MVDESILAKIDAFLQELKEEVLKMLYLLVLPLMDLWLSNMTVIQRLYYT